MPLAITAYVDRLPAPWAVGWYNGPLVRILKTHRHDPGVHAHEYEHVRQWWATFGLLPIGYALSRRVRLWSESKAYAAAIRAGTYELDECAHLLAQHYGLRISFAEARASLSRHIIHRI